MKGIRLIIFIIIIFSIILIFKKLKEEHGKIYVASEIDGQQYLVRDLKDKQHASNQLARIRENINKIVEHLNDNKESKYIEYKPYIEQIQNRGIKQVVIDESSENSIYTSYSVNKGEKLVFCLRSRQRKNKLHDLNLLMYVVLHEMAHVACPEYGHTELFKKIFAFFTNVAIEMGLYKKIEFNNEPAEYCGLMITESIV